MGHRFSNRWYTTLVILVLPVVATLRQGTILSHLSALTFFWIDLKTTVVKCCCFSPHFFLLPSLFLFGLLPSLSRFCFKLPSLFGFGSYSPHFQEFGSYCPHFLVLVLIALTFKILVQTALTFRFWFLLPSLSRFWFKLPSLLRFWFMLPSLFGFGSYCPHF